MDELDQKIAKAIKSNPELRKVQLEARVNFAIADALAELLEFQSESESSIAAKVQIDSARMKSILCAAPGVDITMIELVMLAGSVAVNGVA